MLSKADIDGHGGGESKNARFLQTSFMDGPNAV